MNVGIFRLTYTFVGLPGIR